MKMVDIILYLKIVMCSKAILKIALLSNDMIKLSIYDFLTFII